MKLYDNEFGERSYSSVYTTNAKKILNEILHEFNDGLNYYGGSTHDRREFRRNYEIEYDGYFSYTYDSSIVETCFYMKDCSIQIISRIMKNNSSYSKGNSKTYKTYHSYTRSISPKYAGMFGIVYTNYYCKKMKIKLGSVRC